ncbi:RAMP superfamily CRISPR-associated protein [Ruminococcus flavefaciens]|uniref:RAMP superfamily CRISPR-associated protein n=1 Tax=Ruminococcus flavefaciens TaxID=1265 RepID=UPI0015673E1C|nr:RAMP superfamily CRISPR-associated protein [Ruminococcus flavefaciens]
MRGYIYITLKSDLCAASGDGFSLSIDTDICADRYGLPFIPSRRLKGCLREAAEYIGCERIDSIFGVSGNSNSGSLRIGDARFEDHETLRKQAVDSKYPAEKVLALFTSVKASTAIENDTAKENSLRFTRVVDHYSPFNKSETVFVSEIEYAECDEEQLKNICLALRNIGYKRTRGYGSVRCEFKTAEDKKALEINIPDDDNKYELWLTVKLRSPAMFPGKSSVETADYIPGSAVLGAFAGGYFKNGGDENDFDRLFLSGDVKFSNMYISDGNTVSKPAPAVLGKTKESNAIDYVFRDDDKDDKPLVKPFKGGYLTKGTEIKPEKEVIYHNGQKQGEDGKLLYTQEVLSEGQLFTGTVRGRGKDLRRLLPAIASGCINLGRSKTAQYSVCDIVNAKCVPVKVNSSAVGKVFALLCSDVLLIGENAEFSTDISVLAKALGIESEAIDAEHSSLKYKTVMGYISVGRYKRSHIRAFEKGSVLCFITNTALPKYLTIGERQNEGFGAVKICTKEELTSLGRALPERIPAEAVSADCKLADLIEKNNKRESLRIAAINYADEQYGKVKKDFTPSFVGRLLLMVAQAEDKADLDKRVVSIKTDNKREMAKTFIDSAEEQYGSEWREFLKIALTVIKYRLKEAGGNEQKIFQL